MNDDGRTRDHEYPISSPMISSPMSLRLRLAKNGVATFSRFFILTGNEDIHKSLDEFDIRPDPTSDHIVSCI